MTEGVLIVNVSDDIPEQASDRLPLMVGQLVLTVTSVDQIRGVRLQQGGHPIEAPLVGGALTTAVLVRANYEGLLGGADGIDSAAGPRR